jgi:hypothetical protein
MTRTRAAWTARTLSITAWLAALAVSLTWSSGPASAAPALHVIPFPGTPDASPSSHIIFSSLTASELRSVTVTGSSTGSDDGHLTGLPDGAGTAFIPTHPFAPGEQVRVIATLSSPAAGTASGDPGATTLNFSFTVAVPLRSRGAADRASARREIAGASVQTSRSAPPTQSFRSAPGLRPPQVSATSDPDTRSGDIFLTPKESDQDGPMILDPAGRLVWFRPLDGVASNLEVQKYHQQPVLTWWQELGIGTRRHVNEDVIVDRSYRTVAVLHGDEGYVPDLHEFQLTPRGSALIVAFPAVKADLSSVGGPSSGFALDCVIQELDIRTDQVLWEWHMLGHVPVSATYVARSGPSAPLDFCHMNSIQSLPDGNLLVSARNTWAIYEINKHTGKILWTLGGRSPSFKMDPGTNFEWQHDAHLLGDMLTVFDDGASPQEEEQSSGKVLHLNTTSMTASLAHRYRHSPPLLASVAGSVQELSDRNVFVGWGRQPDFTEYTSAGKQLFNGSFPLGVYSYRAYRFPWAGQPATRPSVALSGQQSGKVNVYVSWNGATGVAAWRVRSGARPGALKALATASRTGFETVLGVSHPGRYLAVQALNDRGKVIGTSPVRTG